MDILQVTKREFDRNPEKYAGLSVDIMRYGKVIEEIRVKDQRVADNVDKTRNVDKFLAENVAKVENVAKDRVMYGNVDKNVDKDSEVARQDMSVAKKRLVARLRDEHGHCIGPAPHTYKCMEWA